MNRHELKKIVYPILFFTQAVFAQTKKQKENVVSRAPFLTDQGLYQGNLSGRNIRVYTCICNVIKLINR